MKILSNNPIPFVDHNKHKVIEFLKKELKEKDITFDQLRKRLGIQISDKSLHRICIDAGYGVIK